MPGPTPSDRQSRCSALLRALLLAALAGASCATPAPPPPAPLHPGYRYVNGNVGVALSLPASWRGFATRAEAPPGLEHLLPHPKRRDESPLLVGVGEKGQAFVRVLSDPVPPGVGAEAYLRHLVGATSAEVEVLSASLAADGETARWSFLARQGPLDLVFRETIAIANGRAIRVSFWAQSAFVSRYEADFDAIESDVLLLREDGWHGGWRDLAATLDPEALADLEYAEAPAPSGPPVCEGEQRGTLWRIPTQRGTMFLFGSFHFGHPDFYPLPAPIEDAFAESTTLVLEIDPSSLGPDGQGPELMQSGVLPEGRKLSDEISPELYAELVETLESLRLPAESFSRMKPWSLALVLSGLSYTSLGYLGELGVDGYFRDRAGDREMVALETFAEQIAVFEKLDGEAFLAASLEFLESGREQAPRMIQAWRCGDEATLEAMFFAPDPAAPPAAGSPRDLMFSSRNRTMADRLEPLLARGGVIFVVVGAGHLIGADGIPALLRERGYPVERR